MSVAYERINTLIDTMFSFELSRKENMHILKLLYSALRIDTKVDHFSTIFTFNAINLMGVSLQAESMGQTQAKKYVQILAIAPQEGKRKKANISLGYFGKAELIEKKTLALILEFVLRWRYEKGFLALEQNRDLLHIFKDTFHD